MNHLTSEEIGDLDGVLSHPHLTECATCRSAVQEQTEIRQLLRALPDPGPTPADVMSRVDQALYSARDRDQPVHVAPPRTATSDRTVVPLPAVPLPTRRVSPWFAVAAALVVLGGAGMAVRSLGHQVSGTSDSAASSAGADDRAAANTLNPSLIHRTGTDYTKARLATQLSPLLSGTYSAPGATPAGRTGGEAIGSSGADSDSATAPAEIAAEPGLRTPEDVTECLSALGMTGSTVLAVDVARFEGAPAAVLALHPPSSGSDVTEVWVVDPGCRPGSDGTLFFTRLP